MGLFRRRRRTPEELQAFGEKWLQRIDPGHSMGGSVERMRQAKRDGDLLREQQETNRLLREQAAREQAREQQL